MFTMMNLLVKIGHMPRRASPRHGDPLNLTWSESHWVMFFTLICSTYAVWNFLSFLAIHRRNL